MNPDRRGPERGPHRLVNPTPRGRERGSSLTLDPADIAPWVIATARAWPAGVEDRVVAVRIGVQPQHVQLARRPRP